MAGRQQLPMDKEPFMQLLREIAMVCKDLSNLNIGIKKRPKNTMKNKLRMIIAAGLIALAPAMLGQPTPKPASDPAKSAKKAPAPVTPPPSAAEIADAKTKGLVWVNLSSGIYHLAGSETYGTTKRGKFMSEADAKKGNYRAAKAGAVKKAKADKPVPTTTGQKK